MKDLHVIDADGHVNVHSSPSWQDYLAPALVGRAKEFWAANNRHLYRSAEGPASPQPAKPDIRQGEIDPHHRISDMELEGIDVAVLVAGGGGEELADNDSSFAADFCRMHNDWLADYCGSYPDRLKGLIKLPLIDVEAAIKELRYQGSRSYSVGAIMTQHVRHRNLDDPVFDPLYATAEEMSLPICIHGGGQGKDQVAIAIDRFESRIMRHALTHSMGAMTALMQMVVGGPMAKFPNLRLAILEAGCGWVPAWVERLDEHYGLLSHQAPYLTAKPSEYLLNRAFYACDGGETMLPAVVEIMGEESVLYASDYCHWDCSFPDSARLISSRLDLKESAKTRILGMNAAQLYAL